MSLRSTALASPVMLLALLAAPPLSAQIIEISKDDKGQTLYCARSGLHGFSDSCGADAGDKYVFIGSVLSVSAAPEQEQRVRLAPEEVFFGSPGKEVVAITNQ